jgi:hypothetical protein
MGKCTEKKVNVSINSVMYETSPEDAENFFMSEVVNTVE